MGKPTGFLEYKRKENAWVPEDQRTKNWDEFKIPLSDEERRCQAGRCMDCGVPFCQSAIVLKGMVTGCPLHNLIPEWNDEIWRGNDRLALLRLTATASFPEFTGRVCPALCEKACMNGLDGEPVTIHDNELYLIEKGFREGWITPRIPPVRSGKKVAVVGAGPSGLAAADLLNRRGHSVTVYEREDKPGGLLMYGIPNMKLDKSVVERRIRLMEAEGVIFKTGCDVGRTERKKKAVKDTAFVSAKELCESYDAVILCCGAKKARALTVPGSDAKGVHFAVDYLSSAVKHLPDADEDGSVISAKDRDVVIVGGGDTGNDCAGTAVRQGCKTLVQIEMMPKPPLSRLPDNPWPEWPKVLKTDYGQQEAIAKFGEDPRIYGTTVKEILKEDGAVRAVKTVEVRFEEGKLQEVPDTEKTIPCSLLLIAAGFAGCEEYVPSAFGIRRTKRGTAESAADSYLSVPDGERGAEAAEKIFTAGDMRRGQSLVVWAIAEGRACAKEVDRFLMGYTNL